MTKMVKVNRKPRDKFFTHYHEDSDSVSVTSFMKRRLSDIGGGKKGIPHDLVWNYFAPRRRWEAMCEFSDLIVWAEAVNEDVPFRKGRTLC